MEEILKIMAGALAGSTLTLAGALAFVVRKTNSRAAGSSYVKLEQETMLMFTTLFHDLSGKMDVLATKMDNLRDTISRRQ